MDSAIVFAGGMIAAAIYLAAGSLRDALDRLAAAIREKKN